MLFVDGSTEDAAYYTIYGNVEIIFSKDLETQPKEKENA